MDSVVKMILLRKNNGAGKLVFCHFSKEIDTVICRLRSNGVTNVGTFDGRTPPHLRHAKLRAKFDVLVLQIRTGCEGLNLQHDFSEVYFVSPHWNPYVEDQAIARCHRMGQTKPVHVFNFIMDSPGNSGSKSLDQYVHSVQQRKRRNLEIITPAQ
jgi:SNF2 family DNA or RNA helicase